MSSRKPFRMVSVGVILASATLVAVGAFAAARAPEIKPTSVATPSAPPVKADAATRAAAARLDPLTRAAFWRREAQIDPADAGAGVCLAQSLRALQRFPEAADAAERVLIAHPDDEEALLEAARAKLGANQGFYAIDQLEHAAKLAPLDWRPLSLLGVAYDQTKRPAQAQQAWARALTLSPDNPAVLSNMALTAAAAGRPAAAEALLRRAVAAPAASAQERQNLALVLGLEGKIAEAEALIRQDLPPDAADANLAYLHAVASRR